MAQSTRSATAYTVRGQSVPVPGGRVTTVQDFLGGRPQGPTRLLRVSGNPSGDAIRRATALRPLAPRTRPTKPPSPGGGGAVRPPPPTGLPPTTLFPHTSPGGGPIISPLPPGGTMSRPPIGSIPGASPIDWGPIIDQGTQFLPDWVRDLIDTGRQALAPGGGASGTSCPEGFKVDSQGRCVAEGIGGALERTLPGGAPGMLTDQYGPAVMGAFGKPALVPAQVGTIMRQDGSVGPVLRCPAGMVLGKDDLCYAKSSITKADRKWKPSPKPPMTASDAKALRRIGTLQKKIKRLAKAGNMSCKKK